jgi:ketosteroid isomerase-like protein
MSEENVEAARRGYEAIGRGDFAAIADVLAPEVTWHGGDRKARDACRNRDQVLAFLRAAHEQGPIGELIDVIEVGEQVVLVMRHQPAGGGEPQLRANLTTFRDGKVTEMVAFESPAAALAATEA